MRSEQATNLEEPEWLLPFDTMAVGDSFFIPTLRPSHFVYVINRASKRAKVKIRSCVTTKDGCLGVRTWRTG